MKKEEFVKRYGEAAWEKKLAQTRVWKEEHIEEVKACWKKYCAEHHEQMKVNQQRNNPEITRKGGKYYEKHREYRHTGLQGERNVIRSKHQKEYRPYKRIIAADSVLHHQWRLESSEYDGVALVEKDQHRHGFVDVIKILDGKITLLTEEEVRNQMI